MPMLTPLDCTRPLARLFQVVGDEVEGVHKSLLQFASDKRERWNSEGWKESVSLDDTGLNRQLIFALSNSTRLAFVIKHDNSSSTCSQFIHAKIEAGKVNDTSYFPSAKFCFLYPDPPNDQEILDGIRFITYVYPLEDDQSLIL
jgi:hypothetical protein